MNFSAYNTAIQARNVISDVAASVVEKLRPRPRYGVVESIDVHHARCTVLINGDTTPITVNAGSLTPTYVGQVVQIGGTPGDRHVTMLLKPRGALFQSASTTDRTTEIDASTSNVLKVNFHRGSSVYNAFYVNGLTRDIYWDSASNAYVVESDIADVVRDSALNDYIKKSDVKSAQFWDSSNASWTGLGLSNSSRVIATINIPAADYRRSISAKGIAVYQSQTISAGTDTSRVCLSINSNVVTNAQVALPVSQNQYNNYWKSKTLVFDGFTLPAGVSTTVRLWHWNNPNTTITWEYDRGASGETSQLFARADPI